MEARSIKNRVAVSVAVLFVAVLVATGYLQRRLVQDDIARLVEEQQAALVKRVAREVDSKFETGAHALSATASLIDERDLAKPGVMRRHLAQQPALLALFDDLLVQDPKGVVTADYPEVANRAGVDSSDRAYFKEVIASRRTVISEPLLGRTRKEPVVQVATPIVGRDGQLVGVLAGVIRLYRSGFLGSLGDERIGKQGYFAILTRGPTPVYVVHPDRARILQPRPAKGAPAVSEAIRGFEGSAEDVSSTGTRMLYTSKRLQTVPWVLIAAVPIEEVYAPIKAAQRRFWIIAGVSTAVLIPLLWILVRWLLEPLNVLRLTIAGMREGDGPFVPLPVNREDEVGAITRQFNELMQQREGAERAQRESEARLRLVADNVPALISYVGADLRFQFANSGYREWLGLDPASMLGERADEVFTGPAYRDSVLPHLQRALAGEATTFEWELATRAGPRTVRTSSFPDRDRAGNVVGIYNLTTDITADRQLHDELDRLARRDSLTGLHNRHSFMEILPLAVSRAARQGRWLALLFVDLDRFKAVNDTLGHDAGDDVLKTVAERLADCVRATDTVSRRGGDEFTVILEGLAGTDEACAIAAKIIASIGEPIDTRAGRASVGASIGIACSRGSADAQACAKELLERADAAAYQAKNEGRGRYQLASLERAPP